MTATFFNKRIVCLGGGIGTVNLIKGLRKYAENITVVISMADDGGSAGRLRRLYRIMPPGDLVSCMAACATHPHPLMKQLLTYRFPGNRYASDKELTGQKTGNLLMVALRDITGDFTSAIRAFQDIFSVPGTFLPATGDFVRISAKTTDGQMVYGEEKIDLGKYEGRRVLEKLYLYPKNVAASPLVVHAIKNADIIICGPGDLYTAVLPVLIIPDMQKLLKESKAQKIFVVNIANKPFETKGYKVVDFIAALKKHLGFMPFKKIIINDTFSYPIPKRYKYTYVRHNGKAIDPDITLYHSDLVDREFPLYHDSQKLANAIIRAV